MVRHVTFFVRPENIEFIALFEASEWSQAEAARRLSVKPATISRYLAEEEDKQIMPGRPVLELFKFILASERPGALAAVGAAHETSMSDWERKVIEDLRWLHKEDRERVLVAMRAIISALPKRPSTDYGAKPQGVSSKIADIAIASQPSALELSKRELREQQRKQSAGATSGHKHGRVRGEQKASKDKPASQG